MAPPANNNNKNSNKATPSNNNTSGDQPGPETPTEGQNRRFFIPRFHREGENSADRLLRCFEFTMYTEGRRAVAQGRLYDALDRERALQEDIEGLEDELSRCERNLDRSQRNLRRAETRIVQLEGQIEVLSSDSADDEDPSDATYQPPSSFQ